jgi:putative nucleotidyltransferase with HDIG domain
MVCGKRALFSSMTSQGSLPRAGVAYVAAVCLAGVGVVAYAAWDLTLHPVGYMWLVLLALTSFSSTFSIKIPDVSATISVSETFVFICALLYGPSPAALVIAIDGLLISCWRRHRRLPQMVFNATEPALSVFVAAQVFFWLSGLSPGQSQVIHIGRQILPLAAFTTTYFLLNSGLNAIVVSLQQRARLWPIWRQHFGWVLLNYFGATSVAALLVHDSRGFDFATLGVVLPLMVISYLTFKISLQRVEDANRHLEELNKLYLSTIETLAMAVDAKDQITHGHIRRVQVYAVRLARALGVKEERQIKAIEAAALLHDMGKLAIPEYILNKPGKLSVAEFEKIKTHASIGADILSAIKFPYPVVPIVRHHHEQWGGKGYPDGLSGADIPIGARILSVVDCFDALTSDRPYRRALSDEEALGMLKDGRGTQYDPLVVDTFARVYEELSPRDLDIGLRKGTLDRIAEVSQADRPQFSGPLDAPQPEVLPLLASLHASSAQTVLADAAEDIARRLREFTPATLCAVFVHDQSRGDLVVAHASGEMASHLRGLRVGLGDRMSGWVAANRRGILNSDAQLDLAELPSPMPVALRACLSTPLIAGDSLVGVLSLYALERHAFREVHKGMVDHAARPLAHLVRGALDFESVHAALSADVLAWLPSIETKRGERIAIDPGRPALAVVALHLEAADGGSISGDTLGRAASALRRHLRVSDSIYRDGEGGLLALLAHADARSARGVGERAVTSLEAAFLAIMPAPGSRPRVRTGVATAPDDGRTVGDLVDAARRRANSAVASGQTPHAGDDDDPAPRQVGLFDDRVGDKLRRAG